MPDDEPKGGPLRSVVILLLVAALVGGMWFVMQQLRSAAAIQDCVASGRRNCAPITSGH